MTIRDTIDAVQAINATITGVRTAPTRYPASVEAANCPLVLCLPADADQQQLTVGSLKRTDRTYRLICYIAPIVQGTSPDQGLQTGIDLLQAVIDAWLATSTIQLPSDDGRQIVVQRSEGDQTDTGLIVLDFGGISWHGFEYRIRVREKWG